MDPLQPVPMPTHAVLLGLNAANTWRTGPESAPVYLAYIATNSTQSASFVSLQTADDPSAILRIAARRSYSPDYQYGVILELHLTRLLDPTQSIHLILAQSGATTYYPPQPIQD